MSDVNVGADVDVAARHERWHVRVRGLRKRFSEHGPEVLQGMDLDLERGKINVIVGASGSGKSVLLKHLAGLLTPTAGHIYIDGVDIVTVDHTTRQTLLATVGFMFQSTALFDSISVAENVAFPLVERTHLGAREIRKRVTDMLTRLGVADAAKKLPAELSGGMRKRVGLARALMLQPQLLLYDEPTTGLDPLATAMVDRLLMEVGDNSHATSVVISHDMSSVFRIADRIAVIHDGVVVAAGTPQELRNTGDAYVREMLTASGVAAALPVEPDR